VGEREYPFAVEVVSLAVTLDGIEYRNRAEIGACRKYTAESRISFAGDEETSPGAGRPAAAPSVAAGPLRNLLVEVNLDHEIDFATAGPDTPFRATLAEPLLNGAVVIAPAGSTVIGRLLELERVAKPVDRYEVVLRLDSVALPGGEKIGLAAKLQSTGGAPGLIRQERRLMPVFDKRRTNRFSVLVREAGPEYAVLYWDARHPRIKKGFLMRWLADSTE